MDVKRIAAYVQLWIDEETDVSIEAVRDYVLHMMKLRYACDPIRAIILDGGTHRGQTSSLKNSIMGTWTAVTIEDWIKDLQGLVIKFPKKSSSLTKDDPTTYALTDLYLESYIKDYSKSS